MNKETKEWQDLIALEPCKEALKWLETQSSLHEAWNNCTKSQWMWWLVHKNKVAKEISVTYAKWCADSVKHLSISYASAYAYAAAAAANASAASAYAADVADAAYAYAANADADADADAVRSKQADFLRTIIPNPFAK